MFIAGNWKMNGTIADAQALAQSLVDGLPVGAPTTAIFPPALHMAAVGAVIKDSPIFMGGQDCSGGFKVSMLIRTIVGKAPSLVSLQRPSVLLWRRMR